MTRYDANNILKRGLALIAILTLFANAAHGGDSPTKSRMAPWQENWEEVIGAAKKEGKVTIYGHVGPQLRIALTKAIKDELGLDLELVPGKGKEVLTRFATEMQTGLPSADILLGGAPALRTTPLMYDIWEKLEPLLILPEVLDTKAWPNGRLPFLDSQKKLIPLALEMDQFLVAHLRGFRARRGELLLSHHG